MIPDEKIFKMIKQLMKFPYSQICIHVVASNLLSALEESGYPVTDDFKALAHAVVFAEDEEAIKLIGKIIT